MIPFTQLLLRYGAAVAAIAAYSWIADLLGRVISRRLRHRIRLTGWHWPMIRFRDENSLFIFLGMSFAAVTLTILIGVGVNRLLAHSPSTDVRVFGGTAAVLILALWLFRLKVRGLRWYALLEFGFAVVVTEQAVAKLSDNIQPVDALVLATSAYLLIRGLDNFKKDLDERRKKAADKTATDRQRSTAGASN